jgi:hypothetical protein
MYQQIDPLESWAYAVEAKYAKTEEEQRRPLALTLYLDPRSYRISSISEKVKKIAREWFKKYNPFSTPTPPPRREAAIPPVAPEMVLLKPFVPVTGKKGAGRFTSSEVALFDPVGTGKRPR